MKKNTITIVLALLCLNFSAAGQQSQARTPLNIGDAVPEMTIQGLQNSADTTFHISGGSDDLIILDFWATWCSSCIKTFPKIADLQLAFKGKVRFLLINTKDTRDDLGKVNTFFTRHHYRSLLPTVVFDTSLNRLFPHQGIPHYVWIRKGRVKAITGAEALSTHQIEAVLAGDESIAIKKELSYNPALPLFEKGNAGEAPAAVYRSTLTPYIAGLGALMGYHYVNETDIDRCQFINWTITDLYRVCYPETSHFEKNRIIFEVSDATAFASDSTSEHWAKQHRYVYEAIFPKRDKAGVLTIIRDDLHRYFGLTLDSAVKDTDCLVLRRTGSTRPKPAPPGTKMETNLYDGDGQPVYYHNGTLPVVVAHLNTLYPVPVVDETASDYPVSFDLPAKMNDEKELSKYLRRQGFGLTRERRKISYLIIKKHP